MQFSDLHARLADVRGRIAAARARGGHEQDVRIVAVTKNHGPDAVLAALDAGVADVGENRVQEALVKQDAIGAMAATAGNTAARDFRGASSGSVSGPRWHLIGHLQRNKVKHLDRFALFHAVDSSRLADAIADLGLKRRRVYDVLLEVNVSGEESKGGFALGEVEREAERLAAGAGRAVEDGVRRDGEGGLRVHGVMTMAPLGADTAALHRVFALAREAGDLCRRAGHPAHELSMGMSGDFEVAVEEGATMVRLGTVLFGDRQ